MPLPDMAVETAFETAFAKVNLALHVRARRPDGYHEIESLFFFAEDGDHLWGEASDDGAIDLVVSGPFGAALGAGPDNLIMRAARALQSYLGEQRGAVIRLEKRLPVASGIGGGSADAAATLRLLVRLWEARMEPEELAGLALDLGSDVPACLASRTQMVGGRGEKLESLSIEGLAGAPMLLVNPGVAVSTADVFRGWDGVDRGALDARSLERLIVDGRNDLEQPAMKTAPAVADVLAALRDLGSASVARMSGSGATCFALFNSDAARDEVAQAIEARAPHWWIMRTRARPE